MSHPALRRLVSEFLELDLGWRVNRAADPPIPRTRSGPAAAIDLDLVIDLVVVDEANFRELQPFPTGPAVIVVGSEPDPGYRDAALRMGADGWVSPDQLCEGLAEETARMLPCWPTWASSERHP